MSQNGRALRFDRLVAWCGLAMVTLLLVASGTVQAQEPSSSVNARPVPPLVRQDTAQGAVYTITIPANGDYQVVSATSQRLAGVESSVWYQNRSGERPLFLINAGFFDPGNHQTTSFVFENGVKTADPRDNHQLMDNPRIQPYMPRILDRTEFRAYVCQSALGKTTMRYDIVARSAPVPATCQLKEVMGAGPNLLPRVADVDEAFVDFDAQGRRIRDPIGVCALNARSALGITANGDVIVMLLSQNPERPKGTGFNLADVAALLKARGAVKAMALDGGSSSGLMYQGQPTYGKFNADGSPVKRPVKSVLMVLPR